MDPDEMKEILSTMNGANGAANTIATGNTFLNILLGSSLKFLWGMINTLQFVVFFTDWNVSIPPNATLAIRTFRSIALGEFIPFHWLTDPLKESFMTSEEEESNGIKGEDEQSASTLGNMGVMLVILILILVLATVTIIFVKVCKQGSKIHNLFRTAKNKIFWNTILRFILQSYLTIALGTMFALSMLSVSSDLRAFNCGITLFFLLVIVDLPIFFAILLHRNRNDLPTAAMRAKIGSIYLGIRIKTRAQRLYSSVFLLRRMVYAILTILCINHGNILIHVFLLTNLINFNYLGLSNPNDTHLGRKMEFFNEIGLQIITYHLALFPLAPTLEDEELAGFVMISAVGLVFIINLAVMCALNIISLRRKLYLRKLQKDRQRKI